jgi:LacI family transcriptional regulator/LacI family purine nucleotide synthesis repressor
VVVPEYLHNDTFFYSEIFWSIETEATRMGCISIHVGVSKDMENKDIMPAFPKEVSILGLIVIGVLRERYIGKLHKMGLPMLSVDIAYHDFPIPNIASSNLSDGYTATKHLIDNNHKKIGFVGPIYTAQSIFERWCGFQLAMQLSNLSGYEEYCITGKNKTFQLFDTPEAFAPHLDELKNLPTAWFCAGDRIAIAMIQLLQKRGLRVPDDVSVIGFDDITVAHMFMPRLTTIRVDRKLMGRLAVDSLLKRFDDSQSGNINTIISGKLIVRDSVKKLVE